jgi:hypothetical protein
MRTDGELDGPPICGPVVYYIPPSGGLRKDTLGMLTSLKRVHNEPMMRIFSTVDQHNAGLHVCCFS